MSPVPRFNVGDLVYYKPSSDNIYADGTKQLGVVVDICLDQTPLYLNFPDKEYFEYEYKVIWILTGYTSMLLGFNLVKLKKPE